MKPLPRPRGFTLIELLVVIAIIGILVAISMPVLSNFRGDNLAAGVRQMMGDVARARQLAISQRTDVYMVFVPTNFWTSLAFTSLPVSERNNVNVTNLYGKQWVAYNFIARRSVGDQPGRHTPRYLSNWKTLPEGVVIADFKFMQRRDQFTPIYDPPDNPVPANLVTNVYGFEVRSDVPFPSELASTPTFAPVPYIGFNHLGQLLSGVDEFIPLGRGSVAHALDPDKIPKPQPPSYRENPAGNTINAFTLIHIDWLTGRARVEQSQIR